MLKVEILDDDLRELIFKGKNKGKYKKFARDKKFVTKLTHIYNLFCFVKTFCQNIFFYKLILIKKISVICFGAWNILL